MEIGERVYLRLNDIDKNVAEAVVTDRGPCIFKTYKIPSGWHRVKITRVLPFGNRKEVLAPCPPNVGLEPVLIINCEKQEVVWPSKDIIGEWFGI